MKKLNRGGVSYWQQIKSFWHEYDKDILFCALAALFFIVMFLASLS